MTVREVVAGGQRYQVTGAGYVPRGQFLKSRGRTARGRPSGSSETRRIPADRPRRRAGPRRVADDRRVVQQCAGRPPARTGRRAWQVIGDPTEGALLVAALKAGIEADDREHRRPPRDPLRLGAQGDVGRRPRAAASRRRCTPRAPRRWSWPGASRERRDGEVVPLTAERRGEILRHDAPRWPRAPCGSWRWPIAIIPDGGHAPDRGGRAWSSPAWSG